MKRVVTFGLAFAVALAACGGKDGGTAPPPTISTTAPSTTTTTTTADDSVPMVAEPSAGDRVSNDFPGGNSKIARLTDVRLARQDGFDRFVMEFEGSERPSHRIRYVEATAVRAPGSGRQVGVDGNSFLEITLQPATAVELRGEEVRNTYGGPRRMTLANSHNVQEAARVGDFEATLSWVLGVDNPAPYAVAWLENPTRLVIDVLPE